jgi:hypothetical protein
MANPSMNVRVFFLFLTFACTLWGQDRSAFSFLHTALITPPLFASVEVGPFGLPFVGGPQLKLHPHPEVPKALAGNGAIIRAALRVGKDGRVKDVRVLECSVDRAIVEKAALRFFRGVVYRPEMVDSKAIEFETDVVLRLKPRSNQQPK